MSAAPETTPIADEESTGSVLPRYFDLTAEIAGKLRSSGAMAVLVVDSSELGGVERRFGVEAHRQANEKLARMVVETCEPDLEPQDLIACGESGVDELVILLFRPRGEGSYYRDGPGALAERLSEKFMSSGSRIVYPYRRDAPLLPVGLAAAIHNPSVREERQVHEALERARLDARLNGQIERRKKTKAFQDLLFCEDVTILYEPIVNITTRETIGYEALVRGPWDTPLHTPAGLFEMAEKTGMSYELDCLCRRRALQGARGLTPGKLLFLNCLPTAIHDPAFRGDILRQTLEDLRLRPSDVVFEISEKESIENFEIFREARDYYAGLGFQIALDDTGVAYGSLEAVMELSPDFIKVDLSFVRGIDNDPPRQELLRAINAVAASIHAKVIAEGIETSGELATIQHLGIAYGQGYLFGRPAPLRKSMS